MNNFKLIKEMHYRKSSMKCNIVSCESFSKDKSYGFNRIAMGSNLKRIKSVNRRFFKENFIYSIFTCSLASSATVLSLFVLIHTFLRHSFIKLNFDSSP